MNFRWMILAMTQAALMGIELTNGHGPHIGDPCPRTSCVGVLKVYSTKVILAERRRIRYLHCRNCKCRPENNQEVLPLDYAPPQQPRIIVRKKSDG